LYYIVGRAAVSAGQNSQAMVSTLAPETAYKVWHIFVFSSYSYSSSITSACWMTHSRMSL
jgi:hypothetical protein